MRIYRPIIFALAFSLCAGCLTSVTNDDGKLPDEFELGEASAALSCCDDPYTVISYRYVNECRLDDLAGRNELWRVEYQVVDTHQVCCCVDKIISHTETEIYAFNTRNTTPCPQ